MSTMYTHSRTAEQIFRRTRRLREQMQIDEEPQLAVPAIWDSGKEDKSTPCEVIITNQRLMGYYSVNFPRKRVFLEDIQLNKISSVTLREKTFEPIFRELLVCEGPRKIYIRAPRRYIEALYAALRSNSEQHITTSKETAAAEQAQGEQATAQHTPSFGRQDVRRAFERSPLAITLLFVGGLVLEVFGFVLWGATHSLQIGLPLFIAGLVSVLAAIFVRRQRN
ncbi:MAG TPA: hypothetical protein VFK47_13285 [Ktedonobacteraceae bacterium]|nr:hypothetical protein [Ktedonobacteraceae bacterium]